MMKKLLVFIFLIGSLTSCTDDVGVKKDFKKGITEARKALAIKRKKVVDLRDLKLDSKEEGLEFKHWEFCADTSAGVLLNPEKYTWEELKINGDKFKKNSKKGLWGKTRLVKDSLEQKVMFHILQIGAAELYVQKELLVKKGDFVKPKFDKALYEEYFVNLPVDTSVTIFLKFLSPSNYKNPVGLNVDDKFISLKVFNSVADNNVPKLESKFFWKLIKIGIFGLLFILHFNFFRTYRSNISNLFLALFTLSEFIGEISYLAFGFYNKIPQLDYFFTSCNSIFGYSISNILFVLALQREFNSPKTKLYYITLALFALYTGVILFFYNETFSEVLMAVCFFALYIYYAIVLVGAVKEKKRGAWVFAVALFSIFIPIIIGIITIIINSAFYNYADMQGNTIGRYIGFFLANVSDVILAICLSIYLSLEYSFTSQKLTDKLQENEKLANENQKILSEQNHALEKKVEERTAELSKSMIGLKNAQKLLVQSEKLASLGELTAGIAHEIQNPMNFVNNFSELSIELSEELVTEIGKEHVNKALVLELASDIKLNQEKINHHGKRASSIVKGMLQHARTSSGQKSLVDLNSLLDEYVRLAYHGLRAKDKQFNAAFELDLEDKLPTIEGVPEDLGRVFLNILNNGFYAVSQIAKSNPNFKPTLVIKTSVENKNVKIDISDNGPGIPEEVQKKLFQPFFTTKPSGEGTGLGLSIAYDIIKSHEGSIELVSSDSGALFCIKLPIKYS